VELRAARRGDQVAAVEIAARAGEKTTERQQQQRSGGARPPGSRGETHGSRARGPDTDAAVGGR